MNITDLDLFSFAFAGFFFFSVMISILYKRFKSIELCYFFSTIVLTCYCLTIFPGATMVQQYLILILFPAFLIYIILNLNIVKVFAFFRIKIDVNKKILIVFIVLFFTSVLIVNMKDVLSPYGLSKIMVFLLCPLFYCYYFPKSNFNRPRIIYFILEFLVCIGFMTGLFSILFYFTGANQLVGAASASLSFFRHPNTTAFIFSFSGPITLYILLFEKEKLSEIQKVFIYICFLVIYLSMLLTLSRAGYIALAVSSFILLFSFNKKIFIAALFILAIGFSAFFQAFVLAKGTVSSISRLGLIYSAIEMLRSSSTGFFFGFGTTSVFEIFTEFKYQLGPLLEDVAYPHNIILFFIMQFGFLALLVILLYFIVLIKDIYKSIKKDFSNNKYLILPFSIVVSIFFQSMLEDTLLFPDFFVFHMFFLFLGMLIYFRNADSKSKNLLIKIAQ